MDYLKRIKTLIGVSDQDYLLTEIIAISHQRITSYLSLNEIPTQLDWILIELSIKKFNRIGSEGMTSESIDGGNTTYEADDFEVYIPYLDKYILDSKTEGANKGWCLL